ncbi:ARM repeat-containing protein [Tuber magnatum]|uniref:ARM repeat-containing protein n=1 Tax=Tuber magnatum TaxID=42249 RepID=A0A317SRW6_9PEZI|nr:ARM repeat-containing protein [Tuber magnatum]
MASSDVDEAKELRLVNNVELKIALADNDEKLQRLLNLYLPPLILKLASPHASVRTKVISICQHVNTRIRPVTIILPVAALLKQFKDPEVGGRYSLVRNFDLMYVQTGIERLPVLERLELLPPLLKDISKHGNPVHQRSLFNILLKVLVHFEPPNRGTQEDLALRTKMGFDEDSGGEDAVWVAGWFKRLMLLNLSVFTSSNTSGQLNCPGISAAEFDFLTLGGKQETFSPFAALTDIKKAMLKFLASGAFTDRERFFPCLVGASDTNSAVAEPAEDVFKRSLPSVSLDDEGIVRELYQLYFGDPSSATLPVKVVLQTRVVGLLAKSTEAIGEQWGDQIVKIVESGLETDYARLRQAAFTFVNWASRMCGERVMTTVSIDVVEKIRYWLLSTSPEDGGGAGGDDLRGYAYESLGLLAKRAPGIVVEKDWRILKFLFGRLRDEPAGSVGVSVEGALATLLPAIAKQRLDKEMEEGLEELIIGQMIADKGRSTRFSAVRYANRVLEFKNVEGRWGNLLALGRKGERGEVVEEAKKGLHPYYYRLLNPEENYPITTDKDPMDIDTPASKGPNKYAFPVFSDLIKHFFPHSQQNATTWTAQESLVAGLMPPEVFATAVSFCRRVGLMEALSNEEIVVDEDWERKLDAAVERDEGVRHKVRTYFRKLGEENSCMLNRFMEVAWLGMIWDGSGLDGVRGVWVDLVGVVSERSWENSVQKLESLMKAVLVGTKSEGRAVAARALGIVGSHEALEESLLVSMTKEMITYSQGTGKAFGVEGGKVHGGILTLGFLLSRLKLRGRLGSLPKELVHQAVDVVVNTLLETRDQTILDAAVQSFSEISIFAVAHGDYFEKTYPKILDRLTELGKKGKEKAVLAIGHLATVFPSSDKPIVDKLLQALFAFHENRQVEVNFATGEAIACLAGGWRSKSVRGKVDIAGYENANPTGDLVEERLGEVLETVMGRMSDTKPSLRKAVCVWMLCLLEFCGEEQQVKSRLGEMQKGFRGYLVDRDELVQETAARGLTMVYEKGDKETKDDLVRNLVSSFTGEKTRTLTGNVSAETELFEPGALSTGDGSISTYKDIMSLASEVGDPSLVYKFMSLARHNSLWSSRAAFGRFGLGSILSSSDILKHNPKLYPKLYRYRFDPNPNVARSMESIWKALIGADERNVLEAQFNNIIEDLLKCAVGREWRTREASCNALGELVQGKKIEEYKPYLEKIWSTSFRVLDDVKESVRVAAMKLCRGLTQAMVRNVDVASGGSREEAEAILEGVMPFLMGGRGLEAEAKEVQLFALRTLLQLVETGGPALLPYILDLVDKFVHLLSSLEPEVVNYLHLNADKYNTTGDDIDRIRLAQVRGSPMMDAIERSLDLLNKDAMKTFVPGFQKTIRKALGLPSKVGCSRIIVTLVVRHGFITKPFADELLKTIQTSMHDRNETVMASYASAAGYLCRLASDEKILGLVGYSRKIYFGGEDEKSRTLAGEVVYALCKNATDRFNSLAVDALPFIFVGKHDPHTPVTEIFTKAWTENTGGTGAIKLYLGEIISLAQTHLSSPRWALKQTAALSLADACKSIGKDVTAGQVNLLWPVLVSATSGKSWDGKEAVLDALVALSVNAVQYFENDQAKLRELSTIVLREARRKNAAYRSMAIKNLGDFVNGFVALNLFEEVYDIVIDSVKGQSEDTMDVDVADGRSLKTIEETTLANGLVTLCKAFRTDFNSNGGKTRTDALKVLEFLQDKLAGANYDLKIRAVGGIATILRCLSTATLRERDWDDILGKAWSQVNQCLTDRSNENVRIKAAEATMQMLKLQGHGSLWDAVRVDLQQALTDERSPMVRQALGADFERFVREG